MGFVGRRWGGQPQAEPDPAEAFQFMADHAPKYWAWVSTLQEDYRKRVEGTVATAYASYQRLKPDDPDLYNVIVQRIEAEDGIFALRMKVRKTPAPDREALVTDLRAQLTTWCDLSLKERRLRLARLRRTVDAEEKYLKNDEANREDTISRRLEGILNGGNGGPFPGGPGFRGDGMRGDRNRGGTADSGDAADPGASR